MNRILFIIEKIKHNLNKENKQRILTTEILNENSQATTGGGGYFNLNINAGGDPDVNHVTAERGK